MKAFGEHLVRAREAAGLSLDDIHQRTRISRKNLLLLEAGDLPSIPQTYVRAFVREYARVVGLDEEDTLTLYTEFAERDRGVPPPPEAIDSSNLLPRLDDSVEFIPLSDRSGSHVEVEGTAEAIDDEYVPKIRKSSYVQEDSAAPIDIRTSPPTTPAKQPDKPPSTKEPEASEATPATNTGVGKAHASAEAPSHESAAVDSPAPKDGEAPSVPERLPPTTPVGTSGQAVPATQPSEPEPSQQPQRKRQKDTAARQSVYDTKPPIEETRPRSPLGEDKTQERRIIGVGLVVIAMAAVAAYGIYFFSFRSDPDESSIDSTAIKASIEAGRFIDSTQAALTELELPLDTLPTELSTPPEPVETKPTVYARDDSLVLEAFTSAPVWFSVKMDTLRTERGSLSSNEHRTWKAREYFVVTLGDAGAVTFFLNGREIGTLGEEGTVVKNVMLSRSRLRGD